MRLRSFLLVGSLLTTVVLGVLVVRQRTQEPVAPPAPVPSAGTVGESAGPGAPAAPFPGELPLITIEGWNPVAGHVDRTDDDGYRAPAPLTLELGGLEVSFAPGSEFAFAEGLPQLRSGSMEVRARLETDYGRYRIPAGGSIGITPDKVKIDMAVSAFVADADGTPAVFFKPAEV